MLETSVLIIGSGPAAYTASIYAARANLKPIQLLGNQVGGQLMITTDVENFPGFAKPITGPFLMNEMKEQSLSVGVSMIESLAVDLCKEGHYFICKADKNEFIRSKTVIIATGAKAKWLGIESESKFLGRGVSACATCDGFFFRGKKVIVVGGGNTAVEEAIFLTNHASHVTLVHRRDKLRSEKILQDRFFSNPKITFVPDMIVDEILGQEVVEQVRLKSTKTNETTILETQGVFIAIGHKPETSWLHNFIELDEEGYIKVFDSSTKTSVPGVFAAGDVQEKVFRQAVVAAGQGCMAALEAQKFLESH